MLRYISLISFFLLYLFQASAQDDNTFSQDSEEEETNVIKEREKRDPPSNRGISIGINAGTFIIAAFEPSRIGTEATLRYGFKNHFFAVAEGGFEQVKFEKDVYDYKSTGEFLRIGFDYNLFNVDEEDNNDNVLLGLRYGVGMNDYASPRFSIKENYWGDYTGSIPSNISTAHWAEFMFGLRTEVLKNFYMGWSFRLRRLIALEGIDTFEPYVIAGYGRADNKTNLSFTYTLEYHIPFKRRK